MRTHSQKITAERLSKALEKQGVTLKRHQLIEVLAHTFGLLDSNDLAAASKRGEIDPPTADDLGTIMSGHPARGGVPLMLLRDPTQDRLFAFDAGTIDAKSKADGFIVSPYGNVLGLPAPQDIVKEQIVELLRLFAQPDQIPEGPDTHVPDRMAGRDFRKIDILDQVPEQFRPYEHLLSVTAIDTGLGPITFLSPRTMAFVDGEPFLGFSFDEEYPDHGQAMMILRDLRALRDLNAERLARVGGIITWKDLYDDGRIEVDILLPAKLADNVDNEWDWWDAVLSLLNSPEVDGCDARFHPQTWVNDYAIDADPAGVTVYDVAFEILTMGREAARALQDNKDDSDELTNAVNAPEWVRNWGNAHWIEIAEEVERFLDEREESTKDMAIDIATGSLLASIKAAFIANRDDVIRFSRMLEDGDEHVTDVVDAAVDELSGKVSATAANQVSDDEAEDIIGAAEAWMSENVSNADAKIRVAAVFHGYGAAEALRRLTQASPDDQPLGQDPFADADPTA